MSTVILKNNNSIWLQATLNTWRSEASNDQWFSPSRRLNCLTEGQFALPRRKIAKKTVMFFWLEIKLRLDFPKILEPSKRERNSHREATARSCHRRHLVSVFLRRFLWRISISLLAPMFWSMSQRWERKKFFLMGPRRNLGVRNWTELGFTDLKLRCRRGPRKHHTSKWLPEEILPN